MKTIHKIQKVSFVSLCFFFTLSLGSWSFAMVDPSIDWEVTKTDHFDIVHDARHRELALDYARVAEKAYQSLVPNFEEAPETTVIWINDSTDVSNGWATALPYPTIGVYPILPSAFSSVGNYDDWADQLLLHEYTHILNFEPAHGLWSPFRFVFGSIVRPNALLPVWYMEGMAVETESRYTPYGRLKSNYYRAMIRAAVDAKTWGTEDIAQINELATPTWPRGMRPYFYGSLLWHEMAMKKSEKIMGHLNRRYSERVPFAINTPAEEEFGIDYQALLNEMYEKREKFAKTELSRIKSHKITTGKAFERNEEEFAAFGPSISPNGRMIAYITGTFHKDNQLLLVDRKRSRKPFWKFKAKPIASKKNIERVSWFPNSKKLVFSATGDFERYYTVSDIFSYDIDNEKVEKVTDGMRARDPVVSPDGFSIAFVKLDVDKTEIATVNVRGRGLQVLYTPPKGIRISYPTYIGNDRIIFSEKQKNGREYLRVLDASSGDVHTVLSAYQPARFPTINKKGILFTSEKTGVANIYQAPWNLRRADPLTNSKTQINTGAYDTKNKMLYLSELKDSGPIMIGTEVVSPPMNPPRVKNPDPYEWPRPPKGPIQVKTTTESYSALPYLFPRYWIPFVFVIPEGMSFMASTGSSDPVGHHTYVLDGAFDTLTKKPSFAFNYINKQTAMDIDLFYSDQYSYIYAYDESTHDQSVSFGGSFFLPGLDNKWRGGFRLSYDSTEVPDLPITKSLGPTLSINYSNTSKKGYQISPESGGTFGLDYTYFMPNVGGDTLGYSRTRISGKKYFSSFLPKRHAIMTRARGFFTPDNRSIRQGTSSIGGEYLMTPFASNYVVRGYPVGEFIGWSVINASIEYRLPLWYPFSGFGTTPIFMRKWHAAVVFDGVTLDGGYYNKELESMERTKLGTNYFGTGIELRCDTTTFYHLPIQFRVGLYYGLDDKAWGGFQPIVGLSL